MIDTIEQNKLLRIALMQIKRHISDENTSQNQDLHSAVQGIVTVARENGLLLDSPVACVSPTVYYRHTHFKSL